MAMHSPSRLGNNFRHILNYANISLCGTTGLTARDVNHQLLLSWWKLVDVNDVRTGFHIRDLIGMRDSSLKSVLNYNECTDIIVDLCINMS